MSELKQMGETLTDLALNFTHPHFSDSYPEWSTVFNIGGELIAMSEPKLNENQEISLWAMKNRFKWHTNDIESGLLEYLTTVSDEVRLNNKEFAQVLQAFATWALDQC